MTNPNVTYKTRGILSTEEIDKMLTEADTLQSEYFRLRAKAIVCILKKFGKRRSEIARLERKDVKIQPKHLEFEFTLSKKRKRGFFQYLRVLEKTKPDELNKPLPQLKDQWRQWQQTQEGCLLKTEKAPHSMRLDDKYALPILKYLLYMEKEYPKARFVFPSGHSVFGSAYVVKGDRPLAGRQLLRILKDVAPMAWFHLFRETKGAETAKEHGRTLTSVFEVRDELDLEDEGTAYRYVRRYAARRERKE